LEHLERLQPYETVLTMMLNAFSARLLILVQLLYIVYT
jgi:hypothetical protein